jgi:hypothetical protein
MKEPFLTPRLIGNRFNGHSLPLEILKDFSALEEMLAEIAKREYLADHPNRTRLPKGFTESLELHLSEVKEGSAVAVITLSLGAGLFPPGYADYYERAKEKLVQAIASEHPQTVLAPELLSYFDRFGRSLRAKESIEFALGNEQKTLLTPAKRQKLLKASQVEEWTEEQSIKGYIYAVNVANMTFELQLRDHSKIKAPYAEHHRDVVLTALNTHRQKQLVSVKGVFRQDRAGHLKGVESVEHITLLDPLDVETRLEELMQLKNGWLDGQGQAPQPTQLVQLIQDFDQHYDPDLRLPYLYPTAEGGIQAEWSMNGWEVSLDIDLVQQRAEFQALNLSNHECQDQMIELNAEGWAELNQCLKALQA